MKKVVSVLNKILIILSSLLFYLSLVVYLSCNWVVSKFSFSNFEEILFTISSPVLNAGNGIVLDFIKYNLLLPTILLIFIICIFVYQKKYDLFISVKLFKSNFSFNLFSKFINSVFKIIFVLFSFVLAIVSYRKVGNDLYFFEYINSQKIYSSFIEENYVNPKNVDLTFPEEKRNLIYIYLESMENTFSSKTNGGFFETNYIPNLSEIALKNLNFSNNDKIGGAYKVDGTTWTMAAMIAHTSGIPLKTPFDGNSLGKYYKEIVPGAVSLGDILSDNAYKNYLMVGSDASFGSRDLYFTTHGNYKIYDLYTARKNGIISNDYFVF